MGVKGLKVWGLKGFAKRPSISLAQDIAHTPSLVADLSYQALVWEHHGRHRIAY